LTGPKKKETLMNTTTDNSPATANPANLTPASRPQTGGIPASAPSSRNAALHNIVVGGIWFVGGILVTAATYSAVKDSGGTYIVAWGAILFGGLQFLKGLCQLGD
jgi:hypothetical protein